jgi:hypothetical protein
LSVNQHKVLPITNYLNQKIVFDLLAVIEDGFSQVKNLSVSNEESKSRDSKVGGEIGLSNGFGLLGIGTKLRASLGSSNHDIDKTSATEDKVHTPASLFSKILTYLNEEQLIKLIDTASDLDDLKSGQFVQFNCLLQQNPLVSLLDSVEQFGVMAIRMEGSKGGKGKNSNGEILKQIKAIRGSLTQNEIVDLICTIKENENLKAVLPVYLDYFFSNNMDELIDGYFTVVGKVVKVINKEDDNINLFRNTGFKLFKQEALDNIFNSFEINMDGQLDIPEISSKIDKPSLLVLPIAIYT